MQEDERLDLYLQPDSIIELAKSHQGISKPNSDMTDEEIADIMKFLASGAPDTMWVDGSPYFGRIGIGLMLSLTLYEFPDFFARHELPQIN